MARPPKSPPARFPSSDETTPRILVVYPDESSFVRTDIEVLKKFSTVTPFRFGPGSRYLPLLKAVSEADIVFSWFALGYTAAANIEAKLLGKLSIVVAGGWDIVGMQEIGYGNLLRRRGRIGTKLALSQADLVLAFSDWSEGMIRRLSPGCRVRRAYLGVDVETFQPARKEDVVVTVANVTLENLKRKGLRTFVAAARSMPEANFVLAGEHRDSAIADLKSMASANVSFPGRLSDLELRSLFARAKVYVQGSFTEGFGVALAEAMASGCVPVVTMSGAIPEVVGDSGIEFEYGNEIQLAAAIKRALTSDMGAGARKRIVDNFTTAHRLASLRGAVQEVWGTRDRFGRRRIRIPRDNRGQRS